MFVDENRKLVHDTEAGDINKEALIYKENQAYKIG